MTTDRRFYSPERLPEYQDVHNMLVGIDRLWDQCPPPFELEVEEDFKVWADYITEQLDRPCNLIREESFGYFFAWRCRQLARESPNSLRDVVGSFHFAHRAMLKYPRPTLVPGETLDLGSFDSVDALTHALENIRLVDPEEQHETQSKTTHPNRSRDRSRRGPSDNARPHTHG